MILENRKSGVGWEDSAKSLLLVSERTKMGLGGGEGRGGEHGS